MNIEALIHGARDRGASDLHVEAGQPVVARVRGELQRFADAPAAADTRAIAQSLLVGEAWEHFLERRSADFSRTLGGVPYIEWRSPKCQEKVMRGES